MAKQQRYFADLARCDEARDDYLRLAAKFDRLADNCDVIDPIDYSAITRDISYLS